MNTFTNFAKAVFATCLLMGLVSCASTHSHHGSHPQIEAAFGPEAGAEPLVLKVIATAKQSIRVSAYVLSSPAVLQALIAAKQRGVEVQAVVDYGHNVANDTKGTRRNALAELMQGGIAVRTSDSYRKLHDKFIIVDDQHVQTGSYNYAKSANKNSENVLVVWHDPKLAGLYLKHWQSRFDAGTPFTPQP